MFYILGMTINVAIPIFIAKVVIFISLIYLFSPSFVEWISTKYIIQNRMLILNFVVTIAKLPGITELSATIILAEILVSLYIFDDAKHLCSWCGFSLANNALLARKKLSELSKQEHI